MKLWSRAHTELDSRQKVVMLKELQRRSFANHSVIAPWPHFLCNFRVIFHGDNESDGSDVFHLLIINDLPGPFCRHFCWDSHHINHCNPDTAVLWSGLDGC